MLLWGRNGSRSQQVVEVSLLDQRAWLAGQRSFTAIEQLAEGWSSRKVASALLKRSVG